MSRPLKDRTGDRVGKLTVISRAGNRGKSVYWLCRCDCGKETEAASCSLNPGHSVSCGCHRREMASRTMTAMNFKHGESRTSLNVVWREMRYRCNTKTADAYLSYGGRGIKVCPEWNNSFEAFRDWAKANGYQESLTIDRKDNDGNYEPDNCRWTDMRTQSNNRRSNKFLTYSGETMTVAQWARKCGIKKATLHSRINKGLSVEEIFNPLVSPINKPQYRAVPPTTKELETA